MRSPDDLGQFIEPVARALLGDPNPRLSNGKVIRFGSNGSMDVDLEKGTAYSHEDNVGGGVLWLIEREKKLKGKDAFDFLREIGCDVPSNGTEKINTAPARIVATYDYTDESGNLLFQAVRFEPKKFLQRKPDGGGWSWKVAGVRQVPYRLPEVMETIANERPIAIVEGEKDADRLWKLGVPATTNAGGAGKWKAEFASYFQGADVIIICDNDNAGRAHGDLVGQTLVDVARSLWLLDLPGLPPKGDASDWFDAGGTLEQFYALVADAPRWAPRPPPVVSRFGGVAWEQIGALVKPKYEWLVEDVVPMSEITLAFGDSGTGKSFDTFAMDMAIARGIPFNGRNVEQGLVVYVAAEGAKGFGKRKLAYCQYHDLPQDASFPFYLLTKRPDLFSSDTDIEALIAEISAIKARYSVPLVKITLDTFSAIAPGLNENASQDVSKVRARMVRLLDHFNAGQTLIHHKPKGGSTPRGHGSLTADFETTLEYETRTDRKSPTGQMVHRGTSRKQRDGKSGIFWEFTLPVVTVGHNKWGNPETSCVVAAFNAEHTIVNGFHATPNELAFMHALFEAIIDHGQPTPHGLPHGVSQAVDIGDVRNAMKARFISGEDDPTKADNRFRQAFKRAGDTLKRAGVIGFKDPLFWYTGKAVSGLSAPVFKPSHEEEQL